jgi:hypothetical protein
MRSFLSFWVRALLVLALGGFAAVAQVGDQDNQLVNSDRLAKPSKPESSEEDVELLTAPLPHPYICVGPSLMGGGYAQLAYRVEGGIDVESKHAIVRALGAYDNGHKVDDADQPNPNGHDRYLESAAYFRASRGWFVGMGWRWNQLSTSNYAKGGTRPEFGGGYDWFLRPCNECRRDFSMRFDVDWVTAGNDWENGSHGPDITLTYPAPSEKRHWFLRQNTGIYRFHQTVSSPTDLSLTQQQRANTSVDTFTDFGVLFRY